MGMAFGQQHKGLPVGHRGCVLDLPVLQGPRIQTLLRTSGHAKTLHMRQRMTCPSKVGVASRVHMRHACVEHPTRGTHQMAMAAVVDRGVVAQVMKKSALGIEGRFFVKSQGVIHMVLQKTRAFKVGKIHKTTCSHAKMQHHSVAFVATLVAKPWLKQLWTLFVAFA